MTWPAQVLPIPQSQIYPHSIQPQPPPALAWAARPPPRHPLHLYPAPSGQYLPQQSSPGADLNPVPALLRMLQGLPSLRIQARVASPPRPTFPASSGTLLPPFPPLPLASGDSAIPSHQPFSPPGMFFPSSLSLSLNVTSSGKSSLISGPGQLHTTSSLPSHMQLLFKEPSPP